MSAPPLIGILLHRPSGHGNRPGPRRRRTQQPAETSSGLTLRQAYGMHLALRREALGAARAVAHRSEPLALARRAAAAPTIAGQDAVWAALILQDSPEPADLEAACALAMQAVLADPSPAERRWLVATTRDRLEVVLGHRQWYGTQYRWSQGAMRLWPVDPQRISDDERRWAGVEPLARIPVAL